MAAALSFQQLPNLKVMKIYCWLITGCKIIIINPNLSDFTWVHCFDQTQFNFRSRSGFGHLNLENSILSSAK